MRASFSDYCGEITLNISPLSSCHALLGLRILLCLARLLRGAAFLVGYSTNPNVFDIRHNMPLLLAWSANAKCTLDHYHPHAPILSIALPSRTLLSDFFQGFLRTFQTLEFQAHLFVKARMDPPTLENDRSDHSVVSQHLLDGVVLGPLLIPVVDLVSSERKNRVLEVDARFAEQPPTRFPKAQAPLAVQRVNNLQDDENNVTLDHELALLGWYSIRIKPKHQTPISHPRVIKWQEVIKVEDKRSGQRLVIRWSVGQSEQGH
ncbi:hypothetical protein PanWU01x14_082920 [Parasponia andersonii]|uniref:Uncharacterized protein n=1 Tax=Parasponia andersonii TaxID=3476 RepID=A0A2P5DA07_PARAD|nr:hypothetical protein PanWU01x14_082920 [Parasponia andersonii]